MNSSDDDKQQTIWEILNKLEIKLIESLQESTNSILPTIKETSFDFIQNLNQLTKKSFHLVNSEFNSLLYPDQIILNTEKSTSNQSSSNLIQKNQFHSTKTTKNWLIKLFKPRPILIITGLFFTSRFALNLFINSDYFHRWSRSNPALYRKIPGCLLTSRAKKAIRKRSKTTQAARIEVIIVLGADPGSAASQIALHFTQIGYIVIASVSRAEYVASLERDGLGWLKALVLDPLIMNQTRAFNRSLAACLNLNFPLNSTKPSTHHQPYSLLGLINCLPISFPDVLRPIEAFDHDDHLISPIQSITGLSLEVIKVVLPMVRNSIEKFGANDGVILTLFPAKTTSVPLPYLGTSLIANQALESIMETLKREIMISNADSKRTMRIINEKIGTFRPSHHFTGPTSIQQQQQQQHSSNRTQQQLVPSLPIHLHAIYAPALSRRIGILNLPSTGLAILSPTGNPLPQLIKRVQEIIESPAIRKGSSISVGNEVWKFALIQHFLPTFFVENWLKFTEFLNGWVRKKVINDVDLESNDNLEKIIQKRNFSSRSYWKNHVFFDNYHHIDHHLVSVTSTTDLKLDEEKDKKKEEEKEEEIKQEEKKEEEKEEEGELTLSENVIPQQLPNPPEFTIPKSEQLKDEITTHQEKEEEEETGSVIDKGEDASSSSQFHLVDHSSTSDDPLVHSFVGSEVEWSDKLNHSSTA